VAFCPSHPKKTESGTYSVTEEDVMSWVENVIEGGHERGLNYTLTAVLYFANRFWPTQNSNGENEGINPDGITVKNMLLVTFAGV
jgi:hypothetical protein